MSGAISGTKNFGKKGKKTVTVIVGLFYSKSADYKEAAKRFIITDPLFCFRKFERFLPRCKWKYQYVTKRQQQTSGSSVHLPAAADSSPVSNTVSVHTCPAPDNLPSWNLSCLKTIVLLRGMGFPVTVKPLSPR